jgi:hypothetical protein
VVGGILESAGIPGFLGNLQALYAEADREGASWRAFIKAWWERYGRMEMKPSDLAEFCREAELMDSIIGDGTEKSQATKIGLAVGRNIDRVFGEYRISCGNDRNGKFYYLVPVQEVPEPEKCGTLRNLCGTLAEKVPHSNPSQINFLDPLAEPAEPFLQVYARESGFYGASDDKNASLYIRNGEKVPHVPQEPRTFDVAGDNLRNLEGQRSAKVPQRSADLDYGDYEEGSL